MPIRLLRPTLRTSERWNRLRYFERCFYISLLNIVDDFGRYEANPTLLASECFPYGDENGLPMTAPAIDGALRALASKGLLMVYRKDGKAFLALERWHERARTHSKYPDPKDCEIEWAETLPANASKCQQMTAACGQMPANEGIQIRRKHENIGKNADCEHLPANASKCAQMTASPPSPSPSPSPSPYSEVRIGGISLEQGKGDSPNGKEWHALTLNEKAIQVLGTEELARRPDWISRIKAHPKRMRGILDAMNADLKIGRVIKNRGAYAEQLWKIAK